MIRRRSAPAIAGAAALFGLALLGGLAASQAAPRPDPSRCTATARPFVVVDTAKHAMLVCERSSVVATFSVRLGKRGTGKTREGDGKTPLGRYALGTPRPSTAYGLFVPIAYPTPEQRRAGYTGGSVGVHGPDRRVRWLGRWVNAFDTTDGCVGLATDEETETFARFVRERGGVEISLE